jgi:cytochrome c oxidase subunit 1
MPRRYASYDLTVGPVAYFTDLHQLATLGVYLLAIGQLIFVWNIVTSWLEGPEVDGVDPWDLEADGLLTNEWRWYERNRGPAVADGGTDSADEEGHAGTD